MMDDKTRPVVGCTPYVLLDCLELPILVADEEGRVLHVSPSFERRIGTTPVRDAPVAEVFDAGARELVLQALASVLSDGEATRFRMRAADVGWSALLSPIGPPGARAGAILLLTEEPRDAQLLQAALREVKAPIEELGQVLETLLEQTGGRRAKRFADVGEDGVRALARVRRTLQELDAAVRSRASTSAPASGKFEVSGLLRNVVDALSRDAAVFGVPLHPVLPEEPLHVAGDGAALEEALMLWLHVRLSSAPPPTSISVSVRRIEPGGDPAVLISIAEAPGDGANSTAPEATDDLRRVSEASRRLGGTLQSGVATTGHRLTTLRLRLI